MSETQTDPQGHEDIRVLREQAANSAANEERAAQAERRLAFLEAGVDSSTAVGQLFIDGYKGELDPNAITEAADKVGALRQAPEPPAVPTEGQPNQPPGNNYSTLEAAAQMLAQNGVQGDVPGGARVPDPDPDPIERGFENYTKDVMAGRRRDDAATHVVFGILEAAAKGDERVLFDKDRDRNGTTRKIVVPNTTMGL
jgi:hypothetical protein